MNSFKTKAGTELPLLKLKGKDYLQVAHRLVWFEEESARYEIATKILDYKEDSVLVQATISVMDENDKLIRRAVATKGETKAGFADYVEKAETGAVGRALAMLGYGTQFTGDEFDEGARLADSPILPASKSSKRVDF